MLHTHQSSQVLDRSQVFIFLQMSINNYSDLCLIIIIIKRERDWWNRKWLYIQHRCMKSFTRTTPTWSCMMPLPCTNIIMIILIHHSIFWSLRSSESVRLIFWPSSCASTFILRFWDNTPPPLILIVVERGMMMIEYARWLTWWWSGWWWSMWRERLKEMRKSCYFLVIKPVSGSNLKR